MPQTDPLKTYKAKRDFKQTKEPSGGKRKATAARRVKPTFVIQKHDASHLHYDFRLEVDGVLKSWAVPKGPSLDPAEKRLAVQVEDHPLDYAGFEGTIPKGSYGAGSVIVWDNGTYRNVRKSGTRTTPMKKCLEEGRVEIELDGKKLKGRFALVRMGNPKNWLLIKAKDDEADPSRDITEDEPESVLSGRLVEDIQD